MVRAWAGFAVLFALLACSGLTPPPAPVPAPAPDPVAAPAPDEGGDDDDAPAGKEHPVREYLKDCHHVFTTTGGDDPEPGDECTFIPFEQTCAEDAGGCLDKETECQEGCGSPCTACQEKCAGTCDSCKDKCGDREPCKRQCARSRQQCRETCMAARTTCYDGKCGDVGTACRKGVSDHCPHCEDIRRCPEGKDCRSGDPKDCEQICPRYP